MRAPLLTAIALLAAACSGAPRRDPTNAGTAASPTTVAPRLRFDGMYRGQPETPGDERYWYYVRFYPDGHLVEVSSTGEPSQVARWLSRDRVDLPSGTYTTSAGSIRFVTTGDGVTVDYEGTLEADGSLTLAVHSSYHDYRATRRYVFVPMRWAP